MDKQKQIAFGARCELARRNFFDYCHLLASDFYKPNRKYLVEMCNTLQDFYDSTDDVLVINEPPRHGKSRTASMFVEWLFGTHPKLKIMTGSYNETLSTVFSKNVRNTIQETKADEDIPVFSDVFPTIGIKQGDAAMNLWSLAGGYNNYLATSPSGTATGFGADIEIIDDLIKNDSEANNETVLDKQWSWFTDTMLSRLESGGKIIIIMTRWSSMDLAGRALDELPKIGYRVRHINMKALQDDGTMLCDEVLSRDDFDKKFKTMSPQIAAANYQQKPIDQEGRLYKGFKTYDILPVDSDGNSLFTGIFSYTDTADEGSDWLASYVYGVYNNEAYILDVVYTQAPMEETEPAVADMFYRNKVNQAVIESNNGGRGFAREVRRLLEGQYGTNQTVIQWFHNSKNKNARIISNAPWIMQHVYFPQNWRIKWPELFDILTRYQRMGKNEHDDACFVAGTKVATIHGDKNIEDIKVGDRVITPFGIRKVTAAGCTGEKEVITNIGLIGTPNHKVFSKKGLFKPLDTFTGYSENDKISLKGLIRWRYQKLLLSMGSSTDLWGRENIILASQRQMRGGNMRKDFMSQFGNFIAAKRFRKAIAFITKTATLLTTATIIWSAYQLGNIWRITLGRMRTILSTLSAVMKNLTVLEKKPVNGITVQGAESGTENTQSKLPKNQKRNIIRVFNAVKNLFHVKKKQSSARICVVNDGGENTEKYSTRQRVLSVEKNLLVTKKNRQQKNEKLVRLNAEASSHIEESGKQKVYNITVDKDHVYYAHGLLVSNCDALTGICEVINDLIEFDTGPSIEEQERALRNLGF